jgi:hypothetical protein
MTEIDPDPETPLSADARAALFLDWRVRKMFTDGVLLEKDGRVAALVNEPESGLPTSELVADLVRRMEARGWSPVVCWRDAPRDLAELGRLLEARATALDCHAAVGNLVREFDLSPPPTAPEPPNDDRGPKKWAEADTSAPAAPERSPTLPEPAAVLDDSAEPVGEIEPAPKASASEMARGSGRGGRPRASTGPRNPTRARLRRARPTG